MHFSRQNTSSHHQNIVIIQYFESSSVSVRHNAKSAQTMHKWLTNFSTQELIALVQTDICTNCSPQIFTSMWNSPKSQMPMTNFHCTWINLSTTNKQTTHNYKITIVYVHKISTVKNSFVVSLTTILTVICQLMVTSVLQN